MSSGRRVTYCGNVHPAEDLPEWLDSVAEYHAPIAVRSRARGQPMGIGAWWSASTAATLAADARARERVRSALSRAGLEIWTLNVFPHGGFHAARVKEAVYVPDWAAEARVRYTLDAARAVAELAPAGAVVPLSTLPLGYGTLDSAAAGANLVRVAAAFKEIEARTGVCCVLALEAEPFCVLDSGAEALAALLELFEGCGGREAEAALRRYCGLCLDLCHSAVVGEDPLSILAAARTAGVQVAKVQVSACLELREGGGIDRLLAFDEPRYLHQTVAASGARALDLGEVAARREEFMRGGRVRSHFHVPVFWDAVGVLGSTRAEVERFLAGLMPPLPLLEVETYTWSVLPDDFLASGDLAAGIAQELAFVHDRLDGS
jgi:sugar phosphate isomerase/epimerase